MQTFEVQPLECSFSKLVTQCLINHIFLKSEYWCSAKRKVCIIFSRISAEFFIVFPFKLKSKQYMSGAFPPFAGLSSGIMEEFELKFSFLQGEFWIAFPFSISSACVSSEVFAWWIVNIGSNVRIWFCVFICNNRIKYFWVFYNILIRRDN